MFALLHSLTMFVIDFFKSPRRLEAENLFLRHQLSIALRRAPPRLRLRGSDRALLVWMTRLWPSLLGGRRSFNRRPSFAGTVRVSQRSGVGNRASRQGGQRSTESCATCVYRKLRFGRIGDPRERFFVNIADPARIIAIDARSPTRISREYDVSAAGPHGLDLDPATGRLMCACDAGVLLAIDPESGNVVGDVTLSGAPDVIFLDHALGRLYVAV